MDLPNKYRPKTLDKIVGNESVIEIIQSWKTIPKAILLTGPSGCGKTTSARIIREMAGCDKGDFQEVNCADFGGIDMVRGIRARMNQSAMKSGGKRIWLIDEAHMLSKDAQNAFLKIIEEPPPHVHFILATTEPGKLLQTIKTRCSTIQFKLLKGSEIEGLIKKVAKKENKKLTSDVLTRISEMAEGSPRKALVLLQSIVGIKKEEAQLDALMKSDSKTFGFEIGRKLLDTRTRWADLSPMLKELEEEPETVRRIILAFMTTVMLSNGRSVSRAAQIINVFQDHYFESGKAGLILNCYEVVTQK